MIEPVMEALAQAGARALWVAPFFQLLLEVKELYDANTDLGKELDGCYDLMKNVCKVLTTIYGEAPDSKTGDELFERFYAELRRDMKKLDKLHKEYCGTELSKRIKRTLQAKKMRKKLIDSMKSVESSLKLGMQKQTACQTREIKEGMEQLQLSVDESNARMQQLMDSPPGAIICDLMLPVDPSRMVGRTEV